jgi:hypothetical protein
VRADDEARRTLLVATAANVGRRLFAVRRSEVLGEGRAIAGGWPGTIREARAVVVAALAPALAQRHMPGPTNDELGWVMHAAYGEARRAWLRSIDRREDQEG